MNRSLSVAVLAAIPASADNLFVRLMRLVAARRAQTVNGRRLARAESDAARMALIRDGLSTSEPRFSDGPPRISISSDYDVLRRIR